MLAHNHTREDEMKCNEIDVYEVTAVVITSV